MKEGLRGPGFRNVRPNVVDRAVQPAANRTIRLRPGWEVARREAYPNLGRLSLPIERPIVVRRTAVAADLGPQCGRIRCVPAVHHIVRRLRFVCAALMTLTGRDRLAAWRFRSFWAVRSRPAGPATSSHSRAEDIRPRCRTPDVRHRPDTFDGVLFSTAPARTTSRPSQTRSRRRISIPERRQFRNRSFDRQGLVPTRPLAAHPPVRFEPLPSALRLRWHDDMVARDGLELRNLRKASSLSAWFVVCKSKQPRPTGHSVPDLPWPHSPARRQGRRAGSSRILPRTRRRSPCLPCSIPELGRCQPSPY